MHVGGRPTTKRGESRHVCFTVPIGIPKRKGSECRIRPAGRSEDQIPLIIRRIYPRRCTCVLDATYDIQQILLICIVVGLLPAVVTWITLFHIHIKVGEIDVRIDALTGQIRDGIVSSGVAVCLAAAIGAKESINRDVISCRGSTVNAAGDIRRVAQAAVDALNHRELKT